MMSTLMDVSGVLSLQMSLATASPTLFLFLFWKICSSCQTSSRKLCHVYLSPDDMETEMLGKQLEKTKCSLLAGGWMKKGSSSDKVNVLSFWHFLVQTVESRSIKPLREERDTEEGLLSFCSFYSRVINSCSDALPTKPAGALAPKVSAQCFVVAPAPKAAEAPSTEATA